MQLQVQTQSAQAKSVGDPNYRYESLLPFYKKARAILGGEFATKTADNELDNVFFSNILIPFSPNMTPQQYLFYRSEAELPNLCSQYLRVLVAGLLRKRPELKLPKDAPEGAANWLIHDFSADHESLLGWLDYALEEEITTSRAWVAVNYPFVNREVTPEERENLKPYPILYNAESVINWRTGVNPVTGRTGLQMVVVRQYVERYDESEFHPTLVDTVWVHELNSEGYYQIRVFENSDARPQVSSGEYEQYYQTTTDTFELVKTEVPQAFGEPLKILPIAPLNGSLHGAEPILMPLVDREAALYNKVSRRNHLMYGAATFTPVISSDMLDEDLQKLAQAGLGSWLRVRAGESISILDTPTDALGDMETAINNTVSEIARMGIRILAPDVRDQSGTALAIKNAHMTAQLSTLNTLISQTMRSIFSWMLNWRYGTDYAAEDIYFNLSPDFNPVPLGQDWLRLITEFYDGGKIPRSVWLDMMKANEMIPSDYDDEKGQQEIMEDPFITGGVEGGSTEQSFEELLRRAERLANQTDNDEEEGDDES